MPLRGPPCRPDLAHAMSRVSTPTAASHSGARLDEDEDDALPTPPPPRRAARAGAPVGQAATCCPHSTAEPAQRVSRTAPPLSKDLYRRQCGRARKCARAISAYAAEIINARPGPVVTLYELDRARHQVVGASSVGRRHPPLDERGIGARRGGVGPQRHPASSCPNPTREKVYLARIAHRPRLQRKRPPSCRFCLGKTIGGESVIVDLSRIAASC